MAPITGKASIAYLPRDRVVDISKLARVLNGYARLLPVQERLTAEVARCIWDNLHQHGLQFVLEAQHGCIPGRSVATPGVGLSTRRLLRYLPVDHISRKAVSRLSG